MGSGSDEGIGGWWRRLLGEERAAKEEDLARRLVYDRFREVLAINDSLHRLIADIQVKLEGRAPFLLEAMTAKVRQGLVDALIMVKDVNQIGEDRHRALYDALARLHREIEAASGGADAGDKGPLVIEIADLRAGDAAAAGVKMANLGGVRASAGLAAPDGFAITTTAFRLFMGANGLWERAYQLKFLSASFSASSAEAACREFQKTILEAPVPSELSSAIFTAFDKIDRGRGIKVAMRSSAVGEDLASSHAGQYYSELNVTRDGLLDAYRLVLASLYKPHALAYRYERGQSEAEAMMAVGCLAMISPQVAGVMFTRDFREPEADRVEVGLTYGLADRLVGGEETAKRFFIGPDSSDELHRRLYDAARALERDMGEPQDVEWAVDGQGRLFILQSRRMIGAKKAGRLATATGAKELIAGGETACPGAGSGVVAHVAPEDLAGFPDRAVAVARTASPAFSRIMSRAAAVITEVGSPMSHLGIIAREYGVPCVVGLEGAIKALPAGMTVTVDATACRVYEGDLEILRDEEETPPAFLDTPAMAGLKKIAALVTPLNLVDPATPDFTPASIRTLHDLTRYAHEKLYEEMFRFGGRAAKAGGAVRLFGLPFETRLWDVGGAVKPESTRKTGLTAADIASAPLLALMEGLTDQRIDYTKPRAVSAAGFLSVVGSSMMGPPMDAAAASQVSFIAASDAYLNFSIRAGYHFSYVDAFLDKNPANNFINFRFAGGGAGDERKLRRVGFLSRVLSEMGFMLKVSGDLLTARAERLPAEAMRARLISLGHLALCSRQLDMLMDSEQSPDFFAGAFLREEFDRF